MPFVQESSELAVAEPSSMLEEPSNAFDGMMALFQQEQRVRTETNRQRAAHQTEQSLRIQFQTAEKKEQVKSDSWRTHVEMELESLISFEQAATMAAEATEKQRQLVETLKIKEHENLLKSMEKEDTTMLAAVEEVETIRRNGAWRIESKTRRENRSTIEHLQRGFKKIMAVAHNKPTYKAVSSSSSLLEEGEGMSEVEAMEQELLEDLKENNDNLADNPYAEAIMKMVEEEKQRMIAVNNEEYEAVQAFLKKVQEMKAAAEKRIAPVQIEIDRMKAAEGVLMRANSEMMAKRKTESESKIAAKKAELKNLAEAEVVRRQKASETESKRHEAAWKQEVAARKNAFAELAQVTQMAGNALKIKIVIPTPEDSQASANKDWDDLGCQADASLKKVDKREAADHKSAAEDNSLAGVTTESAAADAAKSSSSSSSSFAELVMSEGEFLSSSARLENILTAARGDNNIASDVGGMLMPLFLLTAALMVLMGATARSVRAKMTPSRPSALWNNNNKKTPDEEEEEVCDEEFDIQREDI